MIVYESIAVEELQRWKRKLTKNPSIASQYAKKLQTKMNNMIPEKVHMVVTNSIKKMVHATLVGSEYTVKKPPQVISSFEEKEELVIQSIKNYKRAAAAEGAGTGAGGILLGLADFPLLLSIKMRFLFDTASIYGFDVKDYRERLYMLYLFQLAFSCDAKKKEVFEIISNWDTYVLNLPDKETYLKTIDWKAFQLEYRDHIDLLKMLQLIPGFGAIVGAYANYHFLDVLGETAMNGYRLRLLENINS